MRQGISFLYVFQSPIVLLQSGHKQDGLDGDNINERFQSPIVLLQSGHHAGSGRSTDFTGVSIPYRITTVGSCIW